MCASSIWHCRGFETVSTTFKDTRDSDPAAWHHVAVTKFGPTTMFYIDGSPASDPISYATTYTFDTSVSIGSRGDARGGTFYGMIDEPSIYRFNGCSGSHDRGRVASAGTHRWPGEIVYGEHDDRSKVLDGATYSGWPAGPAGNMV